MVAQLLFHFTLLLWSMSSTEVLVVASELAPIAKPNCQSHCGGIEIPYPFGIGAGCYINDDWFRIHCDNSTGYPRPFLNRTNLEVLEISVEGTLKVRNPITFSNCSNKPNRQAVNLEGSPFMFSQKNTFTAVGCGVMATINSNSNGFTISAGCRSECYNDSPDFKNSSTCNGVDCCQTVIPPFLSAFNTSFQPANDNSCFKLIILINYKITIQTIITNITITTITMALPSRILLVIGHSHTRTYSELVSLWLYQPPLI